MIPLIPLILVVSATLIVSALCSLLEATLYSTRMASLEASIAEGRRKALAERFLAMKKKIAGPTAAILILNTIANTTGASVAGMYATDQFGHSWTWVFSGVLTMAILFFSEILPKTYGATKWKNVWPFLVLPLEFIRTALKPAIWVTQKFTDLVARSDSSPGISEEEILSMIRLGAESGEVEPEKLKLLSGVFHFDDVVCRQIMVPRNEVVCIDVNEPYSIAYEKVRASKHTRYPLCQGGLDGILGILHIKDLTGLGQDDPLDLKTLARTLKRVPESLPISKLLRQMQQSKQHMAAVVDEHGTVSGMVTLERVLEEIVGEVQDEFDEEPLEIEAEGHGKFRVRGAIGLDRVNRYFDLELKVDNVDTLSGYLISRLDHFPRVGDKVSLPGGCAEIVETDGERARIVRLTMESEEEKDSGTNQG